MYHLDLLAAVRHAGEYLSNDRNGKKGMNGGDLVPVKKDWRRNTKNYFSLTVKVLLRHENHHSYREI